MMFQTSITVPDSYHLYFEIIMDQKNIGVSCFNTMKLNLNVDAPIGGCQSTEVRIVAVCDWTRRCQFDKTRLHVCVPCTWVTPQRVKVGYLNWCHYGS